MSNHNNVPEQPRQPNSLQGLMRFAMEATKSEDAPSVSNFEPLDEERRLFLEKTLHSLTLNVVELLQNSISVVVKLKDSSADDQEECVAALESILDYVDNMDTANDFYKIGGFVVFRICLRSKNSKVRSLGCELMAEVSQNNPLCQEKILEESLLDDVLCVLSDKEAKVAVKAMYAISCIVRNCDMAMDYLLSSRGYGSIVMAIGSQESSDGQSDKLRTKGSFFLTAICSQDKRVREELLNLNAVEVLCSILMISLDSREHLLSAILSIICTPEELNQKPGNKIVLDRIGWEAVQKARKPELSLFKTLDTFKNDTKGVSELQEVNEYSTRLLQLVFPAEDNADR